MKRRLIAIVAVLLIVGGGMMVLYQKRPPTQTSAGTAAQRSKADPSPTADTPADVPFNKGQFSLTDPTSQWVVVNKQRRLQPAEYVPDGLVVPEIQLRSNITSDERQVRNITADALKKLAAAAKSDGFTLTLQSGYRSYTFQVNLYNRYVSQQGQAVADTQSARAGHSEHQTGLAADVGGITKPACNVEVCFADTPEGKWVAANAHTYGFVIRYPDGKTPITGYIYEPWHLRYVGTELAAEMHAKGVQTLEEFFGLPAAPDYN